MLTWWLPGCKTAIQTGIYARMSITDKLSIEANSVDPEQTDLGPHCLP